MTGRARNCEHTGFFDIEEVDVNELAAGQRSDWCAIKVMKSVAEVQVVT